MLQTDYMASTDMWWLFHSDEWIMGPISFLFNPGPAGPGYALPLKTV